MSTAMHQRAGLRSLLDADHGASGERVRRALQLVVEDLGMQTAFLGRIRGEDRVVVASVAAPGASALPVGTTHPLADTLCGVFASGAAGPAVEDVAAHPTLAGHPHALAYGVGAYAGVPLEADGRMWGALCAASTDAVLPLSDHQLGTLTTVAAHLGDVLRPGACALPGAGTPSPAVAAARSEALDRVADAVAAATGNGTGPTAGVETMSRELLQMLQEATGLDSTYLTVVDWEGDRQRILYSRNATPGMTIPEGLEVPWSDTLCRRSLDEGRMVTDDVPSVWGDSRAAASLGIRTYVSVPVHDADQAVIGTLCGAATTAVGVDPRHLATMRMFAHLIGFQIATETASDGHRRRATELESRVATLNDVALRDPLTGLANRGGVDRWLSTVLSSLRPGQEQLALAFCDLDRFKRVNDTFGHGAGDAVLVRFAQVLSTVGRPGDLHGRIGGDEFVVAAVLPPSPATFGSWSSRLRRAVDADWCAPAADDDPDVGRVRASIGVVSLDQRTDPAEALARADAAMYVDKAARRAG